MEKNRGYISEKEFYYWKDKLAADFGTWKELQVKMKSSYTIVPSEVVDSYYLTDSERSMYLKLWKFANNKTGQTFVSDDRLMLETRKSGRQVQRILDSLEEKGMIERLTVSVRQRLICLLPFPDEMYEMIYTP